MRRYDRDVLASKPAPQREIAVVDGQFGVVVEDAGSGFCGAVVGFEAGAVILEDRQLRRRVFPLLPGAFLVDGEPTTLRRPTDPSSPERKLTASGSVAAAAQRARVAKCSRIWVEGDHDAALVERVWGDDLRTEGIVVEALSGVDRLAEAVAAFAPDPHRRLGILVDHLVPGSKESRIAAVVSSPFVLVAGHPYVDVWQAVRPAAVGIVAWPVIPAGQEWKVGVCAALGVATPAELWRTILSTVDSYRDLETPLVNAVERLIDHVTTIARQGTGNDEPPSRTLER